MPSIPTDQLDSGDDSPKLARGSLLLAVQAVNELFSIFDPDTNTSLLAINRGVTITGPLTVSGTITGTSSSATTLTTGRTISLSGDVTYTSPAFNGSTNVTAAASLATVNSAPGTYGSASNVPVLVVNAKGLVTGYTSTPIAIAASQVTSGTFADAQIAQTSVTQYQSNLSIAETQIPVGTLLARLNQNQTVTGTWTFSNGIVGNISTATKLAAARSISITGDGTWTTSFDGSANVTNALTLATINSGPVTAAFVKPTINVKGLVTATTPVLASDITPLLNSVYVSKTGDAMTGALGIGNPIQYGSLLEASSSGGSSQIATIRYSADSAGPSFALVKTRGTSVTATTAVVAGDTLGLLGWYAQDGTTLQQTATISSIVESAVSSGVIPTAIVFKTTATNSASVTERLRITSAGNVGIGSNPTTNRFQILTSGAQPGLVVGGNTSTQITQDISAYRSGTASLLVNQGANILLGNSTNQTNLLIQESSGSIQFFSYTSGAWSELMRLSSTGAVLINGQAGTSTQVLTSNGPSSPPTWTTPGSVGTSVGMTSSSTAVTTTTSTAVDTWSTTVYRSAKYVIQITDTTNTAYESLELLVIHDGTNVYTTTYGDLFTGSASLGTFDATISSGTLTLAFTATAASTKAVKVFRTAIVL